MDTITRGRIRGEADKCPNLDGDFFVIIKICGREKTRYTWAIRRRSEPLGDKYNGDEYATLQEAKVAGQKALKELLDGLRKEMMPDCR